MKTLRVQHDELRDTIVVNPVQDKTDRVMPYAKASKMLSGAFQDDKIPDI